MKNKNKKIKNLTPHAVNLVGEDGKVLATFPSEGLIRLSQKSEVVGYLALDKEGAVMLPLKDLPLKEGFEDSDGVKYIPITETSFGQAEGLPEEREDTIYIVSSLVCQAYPDRRDFYIPDQTVRDSEGRIVGCRSLSRNPFYKGVEE